VFAADGVLRRHDGPAVLWSGIERRVFGEFYDYKFLVDTKLRQFTDIELCEGPEGSRRNQRDRGRQPSVERRDEHLLLDLGARVGEQPEVQCVRRSGESLLRGEGDPVGVELRGVAGNWLFRDSARSLWEFQSSFLASLHSILCNTLIIRPPDAVRARARANGHIID